MTPDYGRRTYHLLLPGIGSRKRSDLPVIPEAEIDISIGQPINQSHP